VHINRHLHTAVYSAHDECNGNGEVVDTKNVAESELTFLVTPLLLVSCV